MPVRSAASASATSAPQQSATQSARDAGLPIGASVPAATARDVAVRVTRRGSGSTTSVSPSTAATRTRSPDSPRAARVPDLAAHAHPPGTDHLGPLADHPLRPGGDPVAAQEADPEEDLPHLDERSADEEDHPPRVGQDEQAGDRERQDHGSDDGGSALPLDLVAQLDHPGYIARVPVELERSARRGRGRTAACRRRARPGPRSGAPRRAGRRRRTARRRCRHRPPTGSLPPAHASISAWSFAASPSTTRNRPRRSGFRRSRELSAQNGLPAYGQSPPPLMWSSTNS